MVLIAYMITENWEWEDSEIRIFRVIESEEGRETSQKALEKFIDKARIEADPWVIVSDAPFEETLVEYSINADLTILGFELPESKKERSWHSFYQQLVHQLPAVIMVNAPGDEKLLG